MDLPNRARYQGQDRKVNYADILRKQVDIKKVLEHYKVRNLVSKDHWLNCSCPLPTHGGPDNMPSFGMQSVPGSEWNGFFKCWKCGRGDIFKFVSIMEGTGFHGAVELLRQLGFDGDIYSLGVLDKEMNELVEEEVEETEELKTTFFPTMWRDDFLIARYMIENKKRNFSRHGALDMIREFNMGLGNYRGKERIIVPIKDIESNWITFFAQDYRDNSDKLFPKKAPIGKLLFGLDRLKGLTKRVIVAEGVWDAVKICSWNLPGVSTLSTSVSETQAELLTDYFEDVYIAFDNDDGGNKGFTKVIPLLFPAVNIHKVKLPEDKDPCDCSEEEFRHALNKAEKIEADTSVSAY